VGWWSLPTLPPEVWSFGFYLVSGVVLAALPAHWLVKRWDSPKGVELMELDPVSHDHRHLRLGRELFDDMEVYSPYGEVVGTEELQPTTVNGATGYELMDFRVPEGGPPQCVATWMGEASAAEMRSYKSAVEYARKRLSKQADKAVALEANREAIVREAAERVMTAMIRDAERSGTPHADEIHVAVDDVLEDLGLTDSTLSDADVGGQQREQSAEAGENRQNGKQETNGHGETAEVSEGLGGLFGD